MKRGFAEALELLAAALRGAVAGLLAGLCPPLIALTLLAGTKRTDRDTHGRLRLPLSHVQPALFTDPEGFSSTAIPLDQQ